MNSSCSRKRRRADAAEDAKIITTVDSLHPDLLLHIVSFCWFDDVLALRRVSRSLRVATNRSLQRAPALHASALQKCKRSQRVDECLATILPRACSVLTYLDLSGLQYLTGWISEQDRRTWLIPLFEETTTLTTLNLSGCKRFSGCALEFALREARSLPAMQHLYLSGCSKVNRQTVLAVARSGWATSLRTLHIACCSRQDGYILSEIHRAMTSLESLDVGGLERIMQALHPTTKLHNLRTFAATGSRYLRNNSIDPFLRRRIQSFHEHLLQSEDRMSVQDMKDALNNIVFGSNAFPSATLCNLQVLSLDDSGSPRSNPGFGILSCLALRSCQLVEVRMSGQRGIADMDVSVLAKTCGATLKSCNFRDCEIGVEAVTALALHCPHLVELDVSHCPHGVKNESLACLAAHCSRLRTLRMAYCQEISSLDCIGNSLKKLLVLDVRGCTKIRESSLLPSNLIELDTRDACMIFARLPKSLVIKDGRRIAPVVKTGNNCCSACWQSQRCKPPGVELSAMWHCRDCFLEPSRNRGMCGTCAIKCHAGHDVYLGSLARFYCDCAFGFGKVECLAIPWVEQAPCY
jgi:hypothetical protein